MMPSRIWTPVVVLLSCAAFCAVLLTMQVRGYTAASDLDLWGRTLLANEGLIAFNEISTAFPPLSYIGTIMLTWLLPGLGSAAPLLFAALLGGALAGSWFSTFRNSGFGPGTALAATLFLAGNPVFLRAVAEGPAFVLLHWGVWLLALGMFQLRRGHRVNDVILVAFALALIGSSHPFGLIFAFAGLPFLALTLPPDRLREAPGAAFLVLLFPLLFGSASFLYVNWIFGGDPLHFVDTLSRETASLGTAAQPGPGGGVFSSLRLGALAVAGILAVCPISVSMFAQTAGMPPLRLAALAMIGWTVSAAILAALFGLLPPLTLIVSLGVPLAAACAVRWPQGRPMQRGILILLLAGVVGATIISGTDHSSETRRWRDAALGSTAPPPDPELAELGRLLKDRRNILFDAEAAPAVVAMRGRATGIWTAGTAQFERAALSARSDAEVLVVRTRASGFGSDRVGRIFPELYDHGLPGYVRIFDGDRWRAYARVEKKTS